MTARLSQADVAWLTGVSEGWYRALENGTRRDFSDAFLLSVADVLRLCASERLMLFLAVTGRRPPENPVTPAPLSSAGLAVLEQQNPNPACVLDQGWNVVAANSAMAAWFPWVHAPEPNAMRWVVLSPDARHQLVDWESDIAPKYLAMLRFAVNRSPAEPQLSDLVAEVLSDPDCRQIWAREHAVDEHGDGHRIRLRLPVHQGDDVLATSHVLLPVSHPGLRMVILTR